MLATATHLKATRLPAITHPCSHIARDSATAEGSDSVDHADASVILQRVTQVMPWALTNAGHLRAPTALVGLTQLRNDRTLSDLGALPA